MKIIHPGVIVQCDVHGPSDGYITGWQGPKKIDIPICMPCRDEESVVLTSHVSDLSHHVESGHPAPLRGDES